MAKPGKKLPSSPKSKQIASENLPSRHSMTSITKGEPMNRLANNYAKDAPSLASPFDALMPGG